VIYLRPIAIDIVHIPACGLIIIDNSWVYASGNPTNVSAKQHWLVTVAVLYVIADSITAGDIRVIVGRCSDAIYAK